VVHHLPLVGAGAAGEFFEGNVVEDAGDGAMGGL